MKTDDQEKVTYYTLQSRGQNVALICCYF